MRLFSFSADFATHITVSTAVIYMLNSAGTTIRQNQTIVNVAMAELMLAMAATVKAHTMSMNTAVVQMMVGFSTLGAFFAYCSIKGIAVVWYMVFAAVVLAFMVAYAAMFGFDKLKEALGQIHK